MRHRLESTPAIARSLLLVWVFVIVFYGLCEDVQILSPIWNVAIRETGLVIAMALSLPALYSLTRNSRADRFAGALSYPLYINHHLVILVVVSISGNAGLGSWKSMVVVALALALATVLVIGVENRIDRWRQARIQRERTVSRIGDCTT